MINIGTNFGYQGDLFLDDRQGKPTTTEDLRTWSIPIPEGFEVCLDHTWYIYDSTIDPDPVTGNFHKRIDHEYPGSVIETWINYILSLLNTQPVQQLQFKTFSVSPSIPDNILEVNSSPINLSINWTLKKGNNTVEPTNATVTTNNEYQGTVSNFKSYSVNVPARTTPNSTKTFTVRAYYNDESVTKTYTITYKYKKYWGTSAKTTLTEADVLALGGWKWAGSWMMGKTIFDCSGGKYPYYVIPVSDYDSTQFTMWVGGIVNSELTKQYLTVNNADYVAIRTTNIETGQLRIEYGL